MLIMSGKSKKGIDAKPAKQSSKVKRKGITAKANTKGGRKVGAAAQIVVNNDEEMDIKKPLFPLIYYVNDRTQLTDEIFTTMNNQGRLDDMLPNILKDLSMSELKKLCVQQLEVMSKKRIRSILAGVEMDSSSGTEDSGNELENVIDGATSNRQAADSTGLDITENGNAYYQSRPAGVKPSEGKDSSEVVESDMLELHPEIDGADSLLDDSTDRPARMDVVSNLGEAMDDLTDGSSTIAKTYLEILELEMRARAIKSLLKSQPIQTDVE